jgi:hypothetical protein
LLLLQNFTECLSVNRIFRVKNEDSVAMFVDFLV